MPRKIQDFAQQSLIRPVLVKSGRAGAAILDVLQVVEYVKQEAKMVYLLECLQKTPPPVIIFSENKNEVDGKIDLNSYCILTACGQISKNTCFLKASKLLRFMGLKVCLCHKFSTLI
jgi:superfamily II DNA/RNA helicase